MGLVVIIVEFKHPLNWVYISHYIEHEIENLDYKIILKRKYRNNYSNFSPIFLIN